MTADSRLGMVGGTPPSSVSSQSVTAPTGMGSKFEVVRSASLKKSGGGGGGDSEDGVEGKTGGDLATKFLTARYTLVVLHYGGGQIV